VGDSATIVREAALVYSTGSDADEEPADADGGGAGGGGGVTVGGAAGGGRGVLGPDDVPTSEAIEIGADGGAAAGTGGKLPRSSGGGGGSDLALGSTARVPGATATPAQSGPAPFTIIIKGDPSIRLALEHARDDFAKVALAARSVICCRVTPKQKAQLVRLVRDAGHLALAIGDGGNDVSMIQEAHVGVGIRGKEGLQAARASDYQVSQFKALERLLLVHGRYSHYRTSVVAQYSFYKSFLFCFIQIGYAFLSGFSGVSLFNSMTVAAYNAVLFVPIVFFFLDKDIEVSTAMSKPEFYRPVQANQLFNYVTMLRDWFLRAVVQAVLLSAILFLTAPSMPNAGVYDSLGLVMFMGYMFVQDFTMLSELARPTWYNIATIFGLHLFAIIVGVVSNLRMQFINLIDYNSFNMALYDPNLWLTNLLMVVVAICPVLAAKYIWRQL
jgi:phospholipid-translocating ATPase